MDDEITFHAAGVQLKTVLISIDEYDALRLKVKELESDVRYLEKHVDNLKQENNKYKQKELSTKQRNDAIRRKMYGEAIIRNDEALGK